MKPLCSCSRLRCAACAAFFFLAGMARQVVPPWRGGLAAVYAQSAASPPAKPRTQKLANPLNDLLDEAQHDLDTSNYEAAIVPLRKFIAEKPDVAYGHFQLAYAFTALHRTDEARAEYERAIAADPKMPEAYLNLGLLLMDKQPAAAVSALRQAVALLGGQSQPRVLLGMALERSGDPAAAADAFEGALHLEQKNSDALGHLGSLYLNLKRPADAEARFRAALDMQPESPMALLGLAQSLDAQDKPEAADAYRRYLVVQPDASAARARLVHFLVEQQEYDLALAEMDRAEAGKPPSIDALRQRADILIALKKLDDAIVTLRRAIALAPRDAQLRGGLGAVYLQRRDFASAEKELRAALEVEPDNLTFWKNLSSAYYLAGDCPATLSTLERIAKAEPPGPGAWFLRALCYDKLRQLQPALDAYQKFLALDEGKDADQIWQAQQRSKVLKRQLEQKR